MEIGYFFQIFDDQSITFGGTLNARAHSTVKMSHY